MSWFWDRQLYIFMQSANTSTRSQYSKNWFLFLCFYLAVDLARIQQVVPGLAYIRPGMLSILLLCFSLIQSQQAGVPLHFPQIKRILQFIILLFFYIPFVEGMRAAYTTFYSMLLYCPFIFSCVLLIDSKKKLLQLCKIYVLILLFVCIYTLSHGGEGPGGSIGDQNDICLFVVSVLPLVFFVIGQETKRILKLLWIAVIIISLATIVATFSRGGFIGMIVMGVVYWSFSKRKILFLFCIIGLGAGMLYFSGDVYKNEMATVTDIHENTASDRLLSWQAAWDMFLDNPLGVGGNNFSRRFSDYQPEAFMRSMWGRAAHSLWFTLLPETGVVGVFIYFSIIYLNFKDIFFIRQYKWNDQKENENFFNAISLSLLAALFGFFAAGTFISVLYYPIYWYMTALIVCVRNIHSDIIKKMME